MSDSHTPNRPKIIHLEIGDNAFWLMLWTMVAIALGIFLCTALKNSHEIDKAIVASPDPIVSACAIAGERTAVKCMAVLARAE